VLPEPALFDAPALALLAPPEPPAAEPPAAELPAAAALDPAVEPAPAALLTAPLAPTLLAPATEELPAAAAEAPAALNDPAPPTGEAGSEEPHADIRSDSEHSHEQDQTPLITRKFMFSSSSSPAATPQQAPACDFTLQLCDGRSKIDQSLEKFSNRGIFHISRAGFAARRSFDAKRSWLPRLAV